MGDDHADVGRREAGVGERVADRARDAVAVVADREQALGLAGRRAAEHLAEHAGAALCGRGFGLEHQRGRALAEQAAVVARVEGAQRLARDQPDGVVVQHHLRLDRCVVADGDGAIGLAVAQRLQRLDHREQAADAVVRDAGVGALQAVADADVAEHVVGQRAQQPHRVDGVEQLFAELLQPAAGLGEQRQVVVLALVVAAARADVDAAAVAVRGGAGLTQRGAVLKKPRGFDRVAGGVEAEQIGAPDQLVQLAILDERARIEVFHFAGGAYWPAGRIPLRDRADRAAPVEHRGKNRLRRHAGGADGAACGDDDARHEPVRSKAAVSSGWRSTTQVFEPPKPNEFDIVMRTRSRLGAPSTRFRSQSGSGTR